MTRQEIAQTVGSLATLALAGATVAGVVNPGLNAAATTKMVALALSLTPEVAALINGVIAAFDGSKTEEERLSILEELCAGLKPMEPKS